MIVSDAWFPQTNGVVNTLAQTAAWLGRFGHEVRLSTPRDFRTVPCPTYPEIRVAVLPQRKLARAIAAFRPQALHIATEGPLGFSARRYCVSRGLRFTTSYHTQFPQYLRSRVPIPLALSYFLLRWFHGAAQSCMVSTQGVQTQLAASGFDNLVRWRRGVDTQIKQPEDIDEPVLLFNTGCSAGGAGAVNHYWDRDIDARMRRTASRPIPGGRIKPGTRERSDRPPVSPADSSQASRP